MKVLILSCNTGEGHNAAGRALEEYLKDSGVEVEMLDFMKLSSERTSRIVGGAYISIAKLTPHFFGFIYQLGMKISSNRHKSPVYYANALMARHLNEYLKKHPVDILVMPHLYPAETITYMKNKKMLQCKTLAIATDYACIPFWEETNCDAYVIPHEDLLEEFSLRGIKKEKLYPFGIPVKKAFCSIKNEKKFSVANITQINNSKTAKERLKLPSNRSLFLVMGGSMGFGKIQLFTYELNRSCKHGEQIVVICGNNYKLFRILKRCFRDNKNIHIIGFTNKVALYMEAADVVYTKPGGLTSTEVIVKNKPLVHTAPIPGCETSNMEFFASKGMALSAHSLKSQISLGQLLMKQESRRIGMLKAQQKHSKPNACEDIYNLMKKLCGEDADEISHM